jgi:hypothetical protein
MHPKLTGVLGCELCPATSSRTCVLTHIRHYHSLVLTGQANNKKTGLEHSKKMLVTHNTSLQQMVDQYSLEQFSAHFFQATWQYKQFSTLSRTTCQKDWFYVFWTLQKITLPDHRMKCKGHRTKLQFTLLCVTMVMWYMKWSSFRMTFSMTGFSTLC